MTDLTNHELINLIFGGSLTLISLFIDSFLKKQASEHFKIKQQIEACKVSTLKIKYEQIKKRKDENIKINVAIENLIPVFKDQPLYILQREVPIHIHKNSFFNHVTGGKFLVSHLTQPINVQLNDTLVMGSILKEKTQMVRIFGQMQPVVKKNQYILRRNVSIAVFGTLSYELSTNKFRIQPMAMGHSINELIEHYQDLYLMATLPRMFTFLMIGLGVWFMYYPMKKILRKILQRLSWKKEDPERKKIREQQYFRHKVQYKTSKQKVFQCTNCHINPTNIVYKCGHLSICERCHQQNTNINKGQFICPICKSVSSSFIKLYFS